MICRLSVCNFTQSVCGVFSRSWARKSDVVPGDIGISWNMNKHEVNISPGTASMAHFRPDPKDVGGNRSTLFVSPHRGVPTMAGRVPTLAGGTYLGRGVPTLGVHTLDGGYLPWPGCTYLVQGVPTLAGGTHLGQGGTDLGQVSIGSTYYVAGGMPLALTQEDCLVSCWCSAFCYADYNVVPPTIVWSVLRSAHFI